jgi:hypothetical protein
MIENDPARDRSGLLRKKLTGQATAADWLISFVSAGLDG